MRDHDVSQRRACRLVGVDPKTVRRERPPDCPEVRKEMQEIAGKRRRFGYRRIGVLLEPKGMSMNHKKLYRIYREEGLSVKRRRGRKRARGSRTPMPGEYPKLCVSDLAHAVFRYVQASKRPANIMAS